MLRCKHHEGCAVKGVRPGGVHGNLLITSVNGEIHLSAIGFANPVRLHFLNLFRPVQLIQIV